MMPTDMISPPLDFRIEPLHLQIPVALLVDDPAPCVNPYYYARRLREPQVEPRLASGEAVAGSIPLSFLQRFAAAVERHGLRGKFSVLPYPCNLGFIGKGVQGYPEAECREWVATVRNRLAGAMDFSPEMITHLYAVDPATLAPLAEDEHTWSQHQDEESLTRYIVRALSLLAEAGIDASGVTSPWMFGEQVEGAYARAIGAAQKQVHGRRLTWYFLRSDTASPLVPPVIAAGAAGDGEAVVHVRPSCSDVYWQTQDTLAADAGYVDTIAGSLISHGLGSGRIPTLVAAGGGVTLLTHWQSLYSQGRATGLQALEETARRIAAAYGSRLAWRSCTELAAHTAASAALRWTVDATSPVSPRLSLASPFDCPGFTVSFACAQAPRRVCLRSGTDGAAGKFCELRSHRAGVLPLPAQCYTWHAGRLSVCLDLQGTARIELEMAS
jgi:hypothetical protein